MTTLPAVVRIIDLPAYTTIIGGELLEAIQTVGGVQISVQVPLSAVIAALALASTGGTVSGSLNVVGTFRSSANTAAPAGGAASLFVGSGPTFGVYYGSGLPTVNAGTGSLYMRTDGASATTRMYVNTNGTAGWTGVTTVA